MKRDSFRRVLGKSPETMWKLCLSTKFLHQEIRWNYGIWRSDIKSTTKLMSKESICAILYLLGKDQRENCLPDYPEQCSFRWGINWQTFPASIYLYKVSNRITRKRCEMCSKLTIKTAYRLQVAALSTSYIWTHYNL